MKKILVVLLLLTVLGGFAVAQGLDGLSVGAEIWNDPSWADPYGDDSFGIAPFAEFEKSIDPVDIYLKGEYLINLDEESNQAFYLEEALTFNAGAVGPGELSFTLDNYNLFGTSIDKKVDSIDFYPPDDGIYIDNESIKRVTGVFEPSVSYGVDPISFTVGLPIGYSPSGEQFDGAQYIDIYGTLGFSHESGLGIEVTGNFNISHEWADGKDKTNEDFYELDAIVSYTYQDLFTASVEVDFPKNWDGKFGKDYVFIPGIEVSVEQFTVYGAVEIQYYSDDQDGTGDAKTYAGFLAGVKYSF
ncbi:MAG: hypothetical protein LBK13_11730 [Spirochaetales bacterium]|jgi:hypothetical protein|nr:hypothetical protein [Spirochaetales bacterium]